MNQNPNSTEQNEKTESISATENRKKQKILKGILIFSAAVIVLSLLSSLIDPETLVKKLFGEKDTATEPIYFYKIDDELNSLDNEEYQAMDHRMHYNNLDGEKYSVEEEGLSEESDEVIFFYQYFDAVRRGDCEAVAAMYSAQFEDVPDDFTVQMIYDITVQPQTDNGAVYGYRVDYMIYRNNGSFRNDVGSDTNRPLIITLTKEGGQLKIKSILPYTTTVLK